LKSPPYPGGLFVACRAIPSPEAALRNFVPFTSNEQIDAIGRGLVSRTLPKPEWTHAAHFAAALWLLSSHPEIDAGREMPALIRAYNEATGTANTESSGYHETITQASLRAARAFLANRTQLPLFEVCNQLMASPLGDSSWLLTYWSRERLLSVEARRAWVDPDLQPIPC
jgi:hypothetical protein